MAGSVFEHRLVAEVATDPVVRATVVAGWVGWAGLAAYVLGWNVIAWRKGWWVPLSNQHGVWVADPRSRAVTGAVTGLVLAHLWRWPPIPAVHRLDPIAALARWIEAL